MTTYNLINTLPTQLQEEDIINCPYSGSIKRLNLAPGTYNIECWGAKGGNCYQNYAVGGNGGFSQGTLELYVPTELYLVSGGAGTVGAAQQICSGGYNGGGAGRKYSGGGGGATHIALSSGFLYTLNEEQNNILMVAGGGGGGAATSSVTYRTYAAIGGNGGGLTGSNGINIAAQGASYTNDYGTGGSQTEPGHSLSTNLYAAGDFGLGGCGSFICTGGGGAGFYGGGGGYRYGSGGGGSGYINSDLITNGSTTIETTSSNPDTTNYNGYIRITVLSINIRNGVYIKVNNEWRYTTSQ